MRLFLEMMDRDETAELSQRGNRLKLAISRLGAAAEPLGSALRASLFRTISSCAGAENNGGAAGAAAAAQTDSAGPLFKHYEKR